MKAACISADLVLIASVGAGFTVGATLLRWEI
jgi:3-oxoacyl-[acyl-carrier-protein] synthase III